MPQSLAVRRAESLARVHEIVEQLAARDHYRRNPHRRAPHSRRARRNCAPMPEWVRPELAAAYRAKGRRAALFATRPRPRTAVHAGRNTVVVTPTASGKTLCYNLPVLNAMLENPDARALYLFPTKALAQDQLAELHDLARAARPIDSASSPTTATRPPTRAQRSASAAHIVLTNPDMLHAGILPHHTRWTRLFENLRYIVLDELHTYRGVFGSHLANVLRRLRRIARFYGSSPQFIACSATIANPARAAPSASPKPNLNCIEENGAPAGEKFFVFYNPPVVNRFLGIRRGYIGEASRIAQEFLKRDLQTIVFANSRLHTELLLTYLQQANPAARRRSSPCAAIAAATCPESAAKSSTACAKAASAAWFPPTRSSWALTSARSMPRSWPATRERSPPPGSAPAAPAAAAAARAPFSWHPPRRWINSSCSIRIISSAARPSTRSSSPTISKSW